MKKIFNYTLIILGIFILFFSFSKNSDAQLSGLCKVNGAEFIPSGTIPYVDTNRPTIQIAIQTANCSGMKLDVSIIEKDTLSEATGVLIPTDAVDDAVEGFDNREVEVPSTELLVIYFKAGEDECEPARKAGFPQINEMDCKLYLDIETPGGSDFIFGEDDENGLLSYECTLVCDDEFEFVAISGGNVTTKWYFLGTGPQDEQGPFSTQAECVQFRESFNTAYGTEIAGECFSKITVTPYPPAPVEVEGGTPNTYDGTYELLAPIPGLTENGVVGPGFKLGTYVNNLIKVVIGLGAVLAVVMIVFGGIQWMMSDSPMAIGDGKKRIGDAIVGLLLALGSYLILTTINPDLVNINFGLEKQTIDVEYWGDTNTGVPQTGVTCPSGINCTIPAAPSEGLVYSIVNKLQGNTTYRFGGKGTPPVYVYETKDCPPTGPCKDFCPTGTICLDCSGFVNFVLRYSGYKEFNGGTQTIFNNAEVVNSITDTSVNGTPLKPGDLLGWTSGNRHVVIYIGNGKVADSHGGSGREAGNSVGIYSTTFFEDKIKYIKRASPR